MRKKVLARVLIFILIISLSFVIAQDDETATDQEKVDEAYSCLREKIDERTCSELSLEEKIFSLLAVNKCKTEIQDSEDADDCWPDGNCNIKSTAQAILALDNVGVNTDDAEAWLLLQEAIPREMNWYIQIESDGETTCTIYYDEGDYSVSIGEDKKINTAIAGPCLSRSSNEYWLEVSSSEYRDCYGKEFEISCDKDFLTSLLFQKRGSATIHVSETTTSAAAGGATIEKVNSFCFTMTSSCGYEGSLWAALVLDSVGEEISSYMPYLITMSEESINKRYLPESFLYFLTVGTTYSTNLLLKQKLNKYWQESGDKFYDTALALYPFQYEEPKEKIDSKEWLLDEGVQDKDGCWEGNIRNTAFLLYSIWPEEVLPSDNGNGVNGILDCEQADYYCRSRMACRGEGGNILDTYSCSSPFVCCDTPESEETCLEIGGEICDSSEECIGGREETTSDLGYREICCVGEGVCREKTEPPVLSDCELIEGICRDLDCYDNEKISSEDCDYSGDVCCIEKTITGKSTVWIWVLLILIVLVVLGIIFKDQLRRFWFRTKSGGRKPPSRRPRYPPAPLIGHPERMPMPRGPPQRMPARRPKGEMGEVLKKLKEMGR